MKWNSNAQKFLKITQHHLTATQKYERLGKNLLHNPYFKLYFQDV